MDRERRIDNGLRNLIFSLLNIISHKVPYDNYILTFINAVFFLLRTKKVSSSQTLRTLFIHYAQIKTYTKQSLTIIAIFQQLTVVDMLFAVCRKI